MSSSLTHQKINPDALSLFDLPGEVRNKIYGHYFHLPNGFTIHLVTRPLGPDDPATPPEAIISTVYHSFVNWNPDILGPQIADLQTPAQSNPDSNHSRTSLLHANKTVYAESLIHAHAMNAFTVRGSATESPAVGYHAHLRALRPSTARNIRSLTIPTSILRAGLPFPSSRLDRVHWGTSPNWLVILTKMPALQRLTLQETSAGYLLRAMCAVASRVAWFMDHTTKVRVELGLVQGGQGGQGGQGVQGAQGDQGELRKVKMKSFWIKEEDAFRLIFPPVKELVLSGTMRDADRGILEGWEFEGWRLGEGVLRTVHRGGEGEGRGEGEGGKKVWRYDFSRV